MPVGSPPLAQRVKRWGRQRLPDRYERALLYYDAFGRLPRWRDAQLWSEKINLRVVLDRRPVIAMMGDKLAMRDYAIQTVPSLRAPAVLWSGTDVADLAHVSLPPDWVLKPNHRSGDVYFGSGPVDDVSGLRRATSGWLDEFRYCREWCYSQARRLLVVEERIGGLEAAPEDYKFFAFDGEVFTVQHHVSRFTGHAIRHYTPDWAPLEVTCTKPLAAVLAPPPALADMLAAARALSRGLDFVRVDLYDDQGTAVFGELTPYVGSAFAPFVPAAFDTQLGEAWALPPEVTIAMGRPGAEVFRRALEEALVWAHSRGKSPAVGPG